MKNIIAIVGKHNSGKTQSIITIYELLKRHKKHEVLMNKNYYEIYSILKVENRKIGILSYGDTSDVITERINTFKKNNCDIIICATRTRGKTCAAIRDLGSSYNIEYVEKNTTKKEHLEKEENIAFAKNVFSKLSSMI